MNQAILNKLDAAMKGITVANLGDSILQPAKLTRFIRAMQRQTNVLQEARFQLMDSQQVDIDRIGFAGRVITRSLKADGTIKGTETEVKPAFNTNKLQAVELRGKTGLRDRALRRNIERGQLENTLVDLFGEAVGRDWEELGLLGNDAATPDWLQATDGWLEKADNTVTGVDSAHADWPENLFEEMLLALPKQFYINPGDWRFYVPWAIRNAYQDKLRARGTQLGDTTQTTTPTVLAYKGIPVVATAMLERSTQYDYPALLSNPRNMVWGIFHEITIEPDRKPDERATDFYVTVEGDVHYEDENAAVAAKIDAVS